MASLCKELWRYFEAFDDIRDELTHTLEGWDAPIVVVFGPQNAGKSTLLERLAMIPLFPRGEGLCTRVPIRIRLRTGEERSPYLKIINTSGEREEVLDEEVVNGDLKQAVNTYMTQLVSRVDSTVREICTDRIIDVELRSGDLPNIDLLDLPGMVITKGEGDAPDLPEQTYQLVLNTIDQTQSRAIYLAVREAGYDIQQSLTTKVLQARPEIKDRCLGVLTKCDKYSDDHISEQLEASDEWMLAHGYVATMIKPLKGANQSLPKLAEAEIAWFKKSEIRHQILKGHRAGCDTLIAKLSSIYHQYLRDHWAPKTNILLTLKAAHYDQDIYQLGVPVLSSEVSGEVVPEELAQLQVALDEVLNAARGRVSQEIEALMSSVPLWDEDQSKFPQGFEVSYGIADAYIKKSDFLSIAFNPHSGLISQLDGAFSEMLLNIDDIVKGCLSSTLSDDRSSARFARFPKLCQALVEQLSHKVTPDALGETLRDVLRRQLRRFLHERLNYDEDDVCVHQYEQLRGQLITAALWRLSTAIPDLNIENLIETSSTDLFVDQGFEARAELRRKLDQVYQTQRGVASLFELEIPHITTAHVTLGFKLISDEGALTWGLNKVSILRCAFEKSSQRERYSSYSVEQKTPYLSVNFSDAVVLRGYTLRFKADLSADDHVRSWEVRGVDESEQSARLHTHQTRERLAEVSFDQPTAPLAELTIESVAHHRDRPLEVALELETSSAFGWALISSHLVRSDAPPLFEVKPISDQRVLTRARSARSGLEIETHLIKEAEYKLVRIPNQLFAAGETQVTQGLWRAVTGQSPSHFKGDELPVERVSWVDCIRFCNQWSGLVGLDPVYRVQGKRVEVIEGADGFRLPSEREWELAAQGREGVLATEADHLDHVGWFSQNSEFSTHPVAQKTPNAYGLYDMIGNVWEWCFDGDRLPDSAHRSVSRRVDRGGGWCDEAELCTVKARRGDASGYRSNSLGLRVFRSISTT